MIRDAWAHTCTCYSQVLRRASYLGSLSADSHQDLERGEETSKSILKDLWFLFHISFYMKIHESPEIPKGARNQAFQRTYITLTLVLKRVPVRSPRPGLQFHSHFPAFVIHSDFFFHFSSFGVGDRTQGLIYVLSTHNTPKPITQFRQLVKKKNQTK